MSAARARAGLMALALALAAADPAAAQSRLAPDAREIRGYRLTAANVAKVDQVTSVLDRLPPGPPEAPRSDVAMVVVLAMSFAYNEPWRDRQVDEMVGIL